jgi:CHAD domain-containing protein
MTPGALTSCGPLNELERDGLRLSGWKLPARNQLSRSSSLGEVIRDAISSGVARLVRNDPIVRMDTDPDGVHQARVATRRLRSDLRTFRAALDRSWAKALREELGWLGGELGTARDADVLRSRLAARARTLPVQSAQGAAELIAGLAERRARAHAALLQQMDSARYLSLVDRLIDAANAPALVEDQSTRPAAEALRWLVRNDWRALEKKVSLLADPPTDEELHTVRILAKRCRYAAEAAAPVLGGPIRELAAAARDLQEPLGELHDAVVAEAWLRQWAAQASAEGSFAAGELATLERAAAERERGRWPEAWMQAEAIGEHLT